MSVLVKSLFCICLVNLSSVDYCYRKLDLTMKPAVSLLCLHQGNHLLEDYVKEVCELCCLVDFNDVALKGIFRQYLMTIGIT